MRFSTIAAIGAIGAAGLLASGCGGPGSITSHGQMIVEESCTLAFSDYPDIDTGAQVTVTQSDGTVIGTTSLGDSSQKQLAAGLSGFGDTCTYPFKVTVPAGKTRYGITISHRGTIWFSAAQMAKGPGLDLASSLSTP